MEYLTILIALLVGSNIVIFYSLFKNKKDQKYNDNKQSINETENNKILEDRYEKGKIEGYEKGKIEEREKGYNEGYDKGYNEGYEKGKSEGYEKGKSEGHEKGYNEGYEKGYNEGYEKGKIEEYKNGYNIGYERGRKENVESLFYWEYSFDYLLYMQRGAMRYDDEFLVINFQLKTVLDDKKIGEPVKLIDFLRFTDEDGISYNVIEKKVKNKVELMKVNSFYNIDFKYLESNTPSHFKAIKTDDGSRVKIIKIFNNLNI